jgi:hypothetical protein
VASVAAKHTQVRGRCSRHTGGPAEDGPPQAPLGSGSAEAWCSAMSHLPPTLVYTNEKRALASSRLPCLRSGRCTHCEAAPPWSRC